MTAGNSFPFLVAAILVKPLVFSLFGLYRRYWAYATVRDLVAIAAAVSSASAVLAVGITVGVSTRSLAQFSRSVILIDLLLTLVLVGGLRFCVRWLNEHRGRRRGLRSGPRRSVLIVGAGDAGTAVLRELERYDHLGLEPIGMLDDDPVKQGKRIYGVRVLGRIEDLARTIEAYSIQDVIIAMPGAPGAAIRAVAQVCASAGISSRTVPGMFELLDGRVSVQRLREVDIADLLRRPEIIGPVGAASYLTDRCVLVTGAGGSIGLELCRQVAHARPSLLVLLGHGENSIFEAEQQLRTHFRDVHLATAIVDVRDRDRLLLVFQRYRPAWCSTRPPTSTCR